MLAIGYVELTGQLTSELQAMIGTVSKQTNVNGTRGMTDHWLPHA